MGLAKALPKAFSYRIQRCHSRPPERSVFAPFLAGLGPPCRCVSPFWGLGSGASFLVPAQPRPVSLAQPSPAQPKPWCGPCQSSAKAFSYRIQMSHFDWWDKRNRQGTQPSLSPAHKPQAQPSQASTSQARPGQATAEPSPAQAVVWALCQRLFLPDSDQAQPSSAQASPAHHAGQVSPAQLTNRKPSPARPAQVRPGQATAEPSPAQAVVWALPKLCQRLFLTGFRGPILGRRSAPFLLRFWPVWGRRAAAFRRFGA